MTFRPVPPDLSGTVSVNVELLKEKVDAALKEIEALGFVRHDDFPLVPMDDGVVMISGGLPKVAIAQGQQTDGVVAIHVKRRHQPRRGT